LQEEINQEINKHNKLTLSDWSANSRRNHTSLWIWTLFQRQ